MNKSMSWPDLPPEIKYFTDSQACSCKDFWYRGHIRACKHVKAIRQAEGLLDAQRRKNAGAEGLQLSTH